MKSSFSSMQMILLSLSALSLSGCRAANATGDSQELSTSQGFQAKKTSDNCPTNLDCYQMNLPLDYAKASGKKIPLAFAVHPAEKTRKGALLLVFGGPGDSGISGLRDWLPTFDKSLLESYDLVTFDLRGTHRSGNLNCPNAYNDFIFVPARATTAEDQKNMKLGAQTFATECPKEMGLNAQDLRFYNSQQAIQDVNAFRQAMGYQSFTVHSMSYGTQFIQHYATRYPKQMEAIVLDGAVDMTVKLLPYELDLADAQNNALTANFAACAKDASCLGYFSKSSQAVKDIGTVYDAIRAKLNRTPASFKINGETFFFSEYDLEFTASGAVTRAESRRAFMRALAAANAKSADYSLLFKLANGESIDPPETKKDAGKPKTQERIDGSFAGMSNGMFFAFVCNDYGMAETTGNARAEAFISNARSRESKLRIRTALYGELPCAYWPSTQSNAAANQTKIDPSIPTVVVNATMDANVPPKHGFALSQSLTNTALVEVTGGHHIMYGFGNACIDDPVTEFLMNHDFPENRHVLCQDLVISAK